MHVHIRDSRGVVYVIVVANQREPRGHRVLDGGGFLSPRNGIVCFIESLDVGAHPWVSYVEPDSSTGELSSHATRMPFQKALITRVL